MPGRVGARSMFLALLVAALSGCVTTSGPVVVKPGFQVEFVYAAADQDFLVVVQGDPFGTDRATLEAAVVDALQRNYAQYRTHFTTTPTAKMLEPYKIAVVFGDVQPGVESAYCDGSGVPPENPPSAQLKVLAIFCGHSLIAFDRARMEMPAGPGDPAFVAMLNSLAWQLLPADDDVKPDYDVREIPML